MGGGGGGMKLIERNFSVAVEIKFFRLKGKKFTLFTNDVHLSSRKRFERFERVKMCPCYIMRCWKSVLISNQTPSPFICSLREPLVVPVCPPVRQVDPLSPVVSCVAVGLPVCPPVCQVGPLSRVVSRAAVSVPASVPERQAGIVSRHRPHVLLLQTRFLFLRCLRFKLNIVGLTFNCCTFFCLRFFSPMTTDTLHRYNKNYIRNIHIYSKTPTPTPL